MMVHNDKSIVHYEGWSRIDFDKPEMDMESLTGFDHAHLACELPSSSDDSFKGISAKKQGLRTQLGDGFPVVVPLNQCWGSSATLSLSHSPSFVQSGEWPFTPLNL